MNITFKSKQQWDQSEKRGNVTNQRRQKGKYVFVPKKLIVIFIHSKRNAKTRISLRIMVASNNQAKSKSFIRELPTKPGI